MILVTGATGFLGSYLCKYLLQNNLPVRAIKRATSKLDLLAGYAQKIDWVEADLLDIVQLKDAFEGVTHVYHCAAMVSFDPKKDKEMYEVNFKGTANIVNLCLHYNIEKLCYASSVAAIGKATSNTPITEKVEWTESKLNYQYAKTKHLAELEVWRGIAEGLNAVMVNPSMIVGAGYWDTGTCRMFKKLAGGMRICPPGANDFVDVRDVAKIMIKLMNSDIHSERFIVSNEKFNYLDLFNSINNHFDNKPITKTTSPLLAKFAYYADKVRTALTNAEPLITKPTLDLINQSYHYSNEKLLKAIDHTFYSKEETITDTCKAYLRSKEEGKDFGTIL